MFICAVIILKTDLLLFFLQVLAETSHWFLYLKKYPQICQYLISIPNFNNYCQLL